MGWRVARFSAMALLLSLPSAVSAQEEPCATADALSRRGELAAARRAYLALLGDDDPPACAEEGYDVVVAAQRRARAQLDLGNDFADNGDETAALGAYLAALRIDRSLEDARARIDQVLAEDDTVAEKLDLAARLDDGGFEEAADEEVEAALRAGAEPEEVPDDLRGPDDLTGWEHLTHWFTDDLPWIAALVLALGGALLLLLSLVPPRPWRWNGSRRLHHALRTVRESPPGLRSLFGAQLVLGDVKDPAHEVQLGPTVAARIGAELDNAKPTAGGPERVTTVNAPVDLPTLVPELPATLKFIGPLVKALDFRQQYTVSGRLHMQTADAVSITMELTDRRGRLCDSEVIAGVRSRTRAAATAKAETDVAAYLALVPRAGAWAVYALRRTWPQRSQRPLRLVGTEDWRSYADFRTGRYQQDRGMTSEARQSYLRALSADAGNQGALIALASLDVRDRGGVDRAIERLRMALRSIEDEASLGSTTPHPERNLLWYNASYLLAVTLHHRWLWTHGAREDVVEARRVAVRLARGIGRTLSGTTDEGPEHAAVRAQAEAVELAAMALLAGICVEARKLGLPMSRRPSVAAQDADTRRSFLRRLKVAAPPQGGRVIHFVDTDEAKVSMSAQYNMACFYARIGEEWAFDRSMRALRRALEAGGFLHDWAANHDPALAVWRTGRYRDRFEACFEASS